MAAVNENSGRTHTKMTSNVDASTGMKRTVVRIHMRHATFAPMAAAPEMPPRKALLALLSMISRKVNSFLGGAAAVLMMIVVGIGKGKRVFEEQVYDDLVLGRKTTKQFQQKMYKLGFTNRNEPGECDGLEWMPGLSCRLCSSSFDMRNKTRRFFETNDAYVLVGGYEHVILHFCAHHLLDFLSFTVTFETFL